MRLYDQNDSGLATGRADERTGHRNLFPRRQTAADSTARIESHVEPPTIRHVQIPPRRRRRVHPGKLLVAGKACLTDDFDLSLLGFEMGDNSAALLLHDDDRKIIESQGFSVAADKFAAFPSAAGWHLAAFPWNDLAAIDQALSLIFPHYHPTGLPGSIPLDR